MALELSLNRTHPAEIDSDCVVIGLFADHALDGSAAELDLRGEGRLKALIESGDVSGKAGKTTLLHGLPGVAATRVLVVGLGDRDQFDAGAFQKAADAAFAALRIGSSRRAHCCLNEFAVKSRDADWVLRQAAIRAEKATYRYTATRASAAKPTGLEMVSFAADESKAAILGEAAGIAEGVCFARELGNLPPNICNPAHVASEAIKFAAEHDGVECEVIEREEMEQLGMGSLLAVARGSANAPKLIVLKWNGGGDAKPFVLVGKGITFDTGGISLKPGPGMEEMKFDMCGAATVLGSFVAAVKLKLPLYLVTIAAAVENMPDGDSYRPGDVLTSMSGKTIEVLNTDAEGRLILCDALTYAQKNFEPQTLIDVATLTGACVVALGKHAHGLMSKHDDLADELLAAGNDVHDRAWRLPLWDDYQSQLDSVFADFTNLGGKWGGAITAGCFLSRFTEGQRWAHLDIAGSAWDEGRKGLATGRPVNLLVQWLIDRCA